ncbi:cryptochrome/photolyase family protein [Microbulbifer sp. 2304DJ12-6]|uniref:cryptochrome/photolyase family protein n=1 Tax=Microbulbifer sp. 2304DJ12-6 TaxID=3233340 RepID=UPI0039AEA1FC
MKTLRLILGDQLNHKHSWYRENSDEVLYFIAEMRQETDYTVHHIQKIVAFFEAMGQFANWLESRGKQVIYYRLDNRENQQNLAANIKQLIKRFAIQKFEYQLPDEYRLDKQLKILTRELEIECCAYDTEHFFTSREALSNFFRGKKTLLMENFYRHMRKKHDILMSQQVKPEGGKWNYDQSNRNKWKGDLVVPGQCRFRKEVGHTLARIRQAGVKTIGDINPEGFSWPGDRKDSLKMLQHFCKHLLPHFGDFQDAMDPEETCLFHSRLSFSLNCKLLSPREVIDAAIHRWRKSQRTISISQVEGFIRQILGWREYMRGIYWREMPGYSHCNVLQNRNRLPKWYWTADTEMNCLYHTIKNSLEHSYAHHIQRLMITGNFALLIQTHPDQIDAWYLGIYIDAVQWVEMPNTRGMSQFADGGMIATKPYVSSGAYINKMSNYCGDCKYNVNKKTGEGACPFNYLYWNFLMEKYDYFKGNPRMAMALNMLDKKPKKERQGIHRQANAFIRSMSQ